MDVCRPIANVYHNKLAIAVDWFVYIDNTTSVSADVCNTSGSVGGGVYGSGSVGGSVYSNHNSVHNGSVHSGTSGVGSVTSTSNGHLSGGDHISVQSAGSKQYPVHGTSSALQLKISAQQQQTERGQIVDVKSPIMSGIAAGMIFLLICIIYCVNFILLICCFIYSAGLLHDAMVYRHEPSYVHYLALLRERQAIEQQNEQRAKEQQARDESARARAGVSGGTNGTSVSKGKCFLFV